MKKGYHEDDWESVQFRSRPDGSVDERASSHHGYNYFLADNNWTSDAGLVTHDGWGPETHLLLVSGGSHAGNAAGMANTDRYTPGRRVHLVPLEPIAADGRQLRDLRTVAEAGLARPRGGGNRLIHNRVRNAR